MRPGAVIVAVISLILSFAAVIWLGQSAEGVSVDTSAAPKAEERTDFPVPSEEGPHPKAEFAETEHDFGTMRRFATGSRSFEVKNTGEAPLRLKAGETTCQCTVGGLVKNVISPGESTNVELTWTIKQPGPGFQHSAQIHTNDPESPVKTLVIKGFVGVDLTTYPEQRWSLGSLEPDGSTEFDGYVFSHVSDEFEITKLEMDTEGLQAEAIPMSKDEIAQLQAKMSPEEAIPEEPEAEAPESMGPDIQDAWRIHITTNEQIPVGQFSAPLTIHTTVRDVPEISVAVSGVRPGPFQFFPLPGTLYRHGNMLVDAGEISPARAHSAGLLLVCRGLDKELKFEEVESSLPWLKVTLEPQPGEGRVRRYRMMLKFPEGLPPMVRSLSNPAVINIKTNHPHAETLKLKAAFVVQE